MEGREAREGRGVIGSDGLEDEFDDSGGLSSSRRAMDDSKLISMKGRVDRLSLRLVETLIERGKRQRRWIDSGSP